MIITKLVPSQFQALDEEKEEKKVKQVDSIAVPLFTNSETAAVTTLRRV